MVYKLLSCYRLVACCIFHACKIYYILLEIALLKVFTVFQLYVMLTVFKVLLGKIEYHKPRLCIDFLDLQIFSVERWTSWTVEDLLVYVKA